MGFHGRVSKGCERCRQRKVKCDQLRPSCSRCHNMKAPCPGYRDISEVIFRNESARIAKTALAHYGVSRQAHSIILSPAERSPKAVPIISRPLSYPNEEVAAAFFFSNYYACDEPPTPGQPHDWLAQTYCNLPQSHALRAIIDAAGMAGLANVQHATTLASRSREQYGRALNALKQALSDPRGAVADTTLMAVNLFGLYEFITFDDWDISGAWAAHIAGATALLRLRGQEQFDNERGAQLFLQLRSQMLYACMQHDVPLSLELLQLSDMLDNTDLGRRRHESKPGPLGSLVFRLLSLRDATRHEEPVDSDSIYQTAAEIDRDLVAWAAHLAPYATVDAPGNSSAGTYFRGKQHVYDNLGLAQAWNNWRTLRMVIKRMMLDHGLRAARLDGASRVSPWLIRRLSVDVCLSTASFSGSPRIVGLIWPLSVVAREPANPLATRKWAVDQLRAINSTMGFRHAGLLAETISQELKTAFPKPERYSIL